MTCLRRGRALLLAAAIGLALAARGAPDGGSRTYDAGVTASTQDKDLLESRDFLEHLELADDLDLLIELSKPKK